MGGGGNISPRQKMINMMYLVLTALLALNVSAQILEAFETLKESIHESGEKFDHKNDELSEMIKHKVDEEIEQGNTKNEYVKKLTDKVISRSRSLKTHLNEVIGTLDEIAEFDPETGEYHAMSGMEKNYQYWMGSGKEDANGGRGDGAAKALRDSLNGYIEWANKFIKENDTSGTADLSFEPMCEDPAPEKIKHGLKTWEKSTFHSKPVIADLAMVEKFKMDVSEVEYELLGFLKQKLGAVKFKIDSLVLISAAKSEVVVAGMPFESKLFVSMASDDIKPEFIPASGSIKTEDDGNTGVLTINTSGSGFGKDSFEKEMNYSVKAKVPTASGGYELTYSGKYKVRKPEVVITSASVQNLYWKCGNALNVDVPALGELYNPVIKASSADVIVSKDNNKKVTVVPSGKKCILTVSSNTNGNVIKIDDISYKVIKPPRPHIDLLIGGTKPYDGVSPISKKSNIVVKVVPDADFLANLPRDARYAVGAIELLSQRSLGAPTSVKKISGKGKDATKGVQMKLGALLRSDSPGTKIYFKIDKVFRINFKNQPVEEKFTERDLMMGAVIK